MYRRGTGNTEPNPSKRYAGLQLKCVILYVTPSWVKSSSVSGVEQDVVAGGEPWQLNECAGSVSSADHTVVSTVAWAVAGTVASSQSATSSCATTARRERQARAPPGCGSGRREPADTEAAGLCAPAGRRAHVMALGLVSSAGPEAEVRRDVVCRWRVPEPETCGGGPSRLPSPAPPRRAVAGKAVLMCVRFGLRGRISRLAIRWCGLDRRNCRCPFSRLSVSSLCA